MNRRRAPSPRSPSTTTASAAAPTELRIVGGSFRGRKLVYSGDPRTRPMKDRVREAVFNLLGPAPVGKHAVDLFAGTGALGLEALSRGAASATFVERHFPTADSIRTNVATLGCEASTEVASSDTFYWARHALVLPTATPWLVFCSPPYDLYHSQAAAMDQLIATMVEQAPAGSAIVVEADERFASERLPHVADWRDRAYPPAYIYLYFKPAEAPASAP